MPWRVQSLASCTLIVPFYRLLTPLLCLSPGHLLNSNQVVRLAAATMEYSSLLLVRNPFTQRSTATPLVPHLVP
jgi:hypothetical protein